MASNIELINGDCMEYMRKMKDKAFDLAIVDPPYGNYKDSMTRTGGTWNKKYYAENKNYCKTIDWDIAPSKEYFEQLFRVSKEQIIWGGNYFGLPPNRMFLIWKKLTISENFSMAMAEYAWCSMNENAKIFECAPQDKERFHPTQKPLKLYQWLINRYAPPPSQNSGHAPWLGVNCHSLL